MSRESQNSRETQNSGAFERAGRDSRPGLVREFVGFLQYHRKWWLLPVLLVFLILGVLVILGGTGAAPFIYTLF